MPELTAKELTKLEKQIETLETKVQQKDSELNELKDKAKKRPSLGYLRSRFK